MSTRRTFLAMSSAAFAHVLAPHLLAQRRGAPVFSNATLEPYLQGELTYARFQQLVGTSFRAFVEDDAVVDMRLLHVTTLVEYATATAATLPATPERTARLAKLLKRLPAPEDCFRLQFATGRQHIPEASYTVDQPSLGSFTALVVPGMPAEAENTCSISFSRLPQGTLATAEALRNAPRPFTR